jgi:hypothetical protein
MILVWLGVIGVSRKIGIGYINVSYYHLECKQEGK